MASTRPWYKMFPSDILTDLKYRALPPLARLIYRELLDLLWTEECALPDDPELLAGAVGLNLEEFKRYWALIQRPSAPCFIPHPDRPGMITNKRMLKEWEAAVEASEQAAAKGRKGGKARAARLRQQAESPCQATAKPQLSNSQTTAKPNPSDPESESDPEEDIKYSPDGEYSSPAVADDAPAATKSGSNGKGKARPGPPPCPHEEIIALYHEVLPELPRVKIWNKTRRRYLQARWREDPERQNLDWWLRYFEQVRASPFLLGQVDNRDGPPFQADLEWLIRPRNMPKVLEGRYSRDRGQRNGESEFLRLAKERFGAKEDAGVARGV